MKETEIFKIFKILEKYYGWLGWWPFIKNGKDKPLYHNKKSYEITEQNIFEICIGAILTQNTNWKNVEKALVNLNKRKLLLPEKILNTNEKILIEAIRPSGYYNQKLKKIKIFSDFIIKNPIRKLKRIEKNIFRNILLDLWGIGKETADSILLYGFNKKIFVVDAYTKRFFFRLGLIESDLEYDEIRIIIENNIPSNINLYKNSHACIVEICKDFCKSKPLCEECIFKIGRKYSCQYQ